MLEEEHRLERMRHMAKESRAVHTDEHDTDVHTRHGEERLAPMVEFIKELSAEKLVVIARAFVHFRGVANVAKAHHRCRRLRMDPTKEGSKGVDKRNLGTNCLRA